MHVKNLANQLVLNGSTSPSADLAQLDRIDEQLREAMVCIRSARNSISPANRLPPEVMSPIFAELASSARRELDPQRPTKRFMSVVAVCRHWRRTALSCHALWATVVIDKWTSPEAAAAVLRRSGVLPLTVFFRKAGELLSVLTPHVSRLRRLCLIKTAPFTLFPFFAPPTDCFERLTQLYLCNLCYDQLRHLDTFFDFIEATPNLETLDLNEASQFPRPNEVSVFPLQRRLALPRLRTLCFHGCRWEAIAWVLRHFTFSGSVSIYAEVNSLTYLTDMGAVFQEDAAFLSHLRALTKLDVWAIANKLCMSCSGLGVALELCFIWNGYIVDGDIRGVNSMFMALLPRILHLIDVTELRMKIGGKHLPYIGSIQDLFQDLPAVESCTIELGLEKDKAQYWHACLVEGEVEGNVPFTHLQALHFIGEPDLLEDVIWMLRLARRRAGVGRRLRKLICPVPRSASAGAWNPDGIRVDGEHVVAFVDSVEWNATPPMTEPDIRGWDSVI